MSCPICKHTMSQLGLDQVNRRVFWCPRCGTLKTITQAVTVKEEFEESESPKLVARARLLADAMDHNDRGVQNHLMAVKESVGVSN